MARYGFDPETGRLNIHPDFWKDPDPNVRPTMGAATPDRLKPPVERRISLPEWAEAQLPTGASRDSARIALHGLARTGNTILKFLDIPNRVADRTRRDVRVAARAGDADRFALSRNFLATDETPDTLFGIPVVADRSRYTPEDLAFFRKHPEAGGYYDMGDEGSPEDGSAEGAPVQADVPKRRIPPIVKGPIHHGPPPPPKRGAYPGSLNNPGNVSKHSREKWWPGEIATPSRRWAKFDTPQNGLNASADSIHRIIENELSRKGKPFTIRNYAHVYAPATENDTETYIRHLSEYSGIGADEELYRDDVGSIARLLKAKVRFESGVPHSEWFTDDEYNTAAEVMRRKWVD